MHISVIIPTYNVSNCIERAIRSALTQTLEPLEVIVVDDGSTDATPAVVARLAQTDPRIQLSLMPANKGPAAARNHAIELATGDWIAILDADDIFLPDRLCLLTKSAARNQSTFAADNIEFYDAGADKVTRLAIDPSVIGDCLDLDCHTFIRNCMTNTPRAVDFGLLKPIMRRDFLVASKVRYPEDCRHGEDFIFYLHAVMAGARFSLFSYAGYRYSERLGATSGEASGHSRTIVGYRDMERQTRDLAKQPHILADPILASLLIARADRIKALYTQSELRHLVRSQNYFNLATRLVSDPAARVCMFQTLQRKLLPDYIAPDRPRA